MTLSDFNKEHMDAIHRMTNDQFWEWWRVAHEMLGTSPEDGSVKVMVGDDSYLVLARPTGLALVRADQYDDYLIATKQGD